MIPAKNATRAPITLAGAYGVKMRTASPRTSADIVPCLILRSRCSFFRRANVSFARMCNFTNSMPRGVSSRRSRMRSSTLNVSFPVQIAGLSRSGIWLMLAMISSADVRSTEVGGIGGGFQGGMFVLLLVKLRRAGFSYKNYHLT